MSSKTREKAKQEAELLRELLNGRPVLITGGGGFLGGEIATQLRSVDIVVRSISRSRYEALDRLGVEQFLGDVSDSAAVAKAVAGCGVVIHGAAKVGAAGPYSEFERINVGGTRAVVEACKGQGVSALVHTSTPSVVFSGGNIEGADESLPLSTQHHSAYTATKAEAETVALNGNTPDGLAVCALRPHLVWGPGDRHILPRLVTRRRSGKLRRVGDGSNVVDVTFVGDGARAHILAAIALLERRPGVCGKPFFISQGTPVKLWWMIDRMLEAAGQPPVNRSISVRGAWIAGAILESVYKVFRLKGEPIMTRWVAEELATSHWFDISAARQELGFEPSVTIEEGLQELKSWCDAHPGEVG